jgi:hypothetical protein
VFTGAALIVLVFWLTLKRLGPQPAHMWWTLGLFWLALTLAFEVGLGRAARDVLGPDRGRFRPASWRSVVVRHAGHPRRTAMDRGTARLAAATAMSATSSASASPRSAAVVPTSAAEPLARSLLSPER